MTNNLTGEFIGYSFEVGELNNERLQLNKADLLKYEKYNFKNFHRVTYALASNPSIFNHADYIIKGRDYDFMEKDVAEEDFPADEIRR